MTTGHNAEVLQTLADEQRAAAQPAPTAPSTTADNTEDAVPAAPVAPPSEPVAKATPVRKGSAATS